VLVTNKRQTLASLRQQNADPPSGRSARNHGAGSDLVRGG